MGHKFRVIVLECLDGMVVVKRLVLVSSPSPAIAKAGAMQMKAQTPTELTAHVEATQGIDAHVQRQTAEEPQYTELEAAMIWDAQTVPFDEHYGSASFLLVLFFMSLNAAMFVLGYFLFCVSVWDMLPGVSVLWATAVWSLLLTMEVIAYRLSLLADIRGAITRKNLARKWERLGLAQSAEQVEGPEWRRPVALVCGGIPTLLLFILASMKTPWS